MPQVLHSVQPAAPDRLIPVGLLAIPRHGHRKSAPATCPDKTHPTTRRALCLSLSSVPRVAVQPTRRRLPLSGLRRLVSGTTEYPSRSSRLALTESWGC